MTKRLIVILLSFLAFLTGSGDVLLWTIDESTTVDGIAIKTFLEPYTSDYDHFPAARVKMISNNGQTSTILPVIGHEDEPVYWGQEPYDSGSGYWGIGAPVGVQSQTGYNTIGTI